MYCYLILRQQPSSRTYIQRDERSVAGQEQSLLVQMQKNRTTLTHKGREIEMRQYKIKMNGILANSNAKANAEHILHSLALSLRRDFLPIILLFFVILFYALLKFSSTSSLCACAKSNESM